MMLTATAQSTDIPVGVLIAAISILAVILTAAFSIIAYFLKDIRNGMKEKQHEQDKRIEATEKSLADLREMLPEKYVLRDDWLRTMSAFDSKLDALSTEIKKLVEKIGGYFKGGSES